MSAGDDVQATATGGRSRAAFSISRPQPRREAHVGEDHHPPAVDGVGEGAAHEGGDEQGQELGQAEQAHLEADEWVRRYIC